MIFYLDAKIVYLNRVKLVFKILFSIWVQDSNQINYFSWQLLKLNISKFHSIDSDKKNNSITLPGSF